VYEKLPEDEKRLWHSHEFEVKSGMLVHPNISNKYSAVWEQAELQMMKEVIGLYGKTWHFWQVDRGDELPLGYPTLMGSLTQADQLDLDQALDGRDKRVGVDHKEKARQREEIQVPKIHPSANNWWQESSGKGVN
jgi:Protein of unknown function (DUF1264)